MCFSTAFLVICNVVLHFKATSFRFQYLLVFVFCNVQDYFIFPLKKDYFILDYYDYFGLYSIPWQGILIFSSLMKFKNKVIIYYLKFCYIFKFIFL